MTSPQAFICDAIRTPFGRYGGALSSVRTDDLGAIPLRRADGAQPRMWTGPAVDDVIYGCANQAGEDNRNVAHMAACWPGCRLRCRGHPQPPVRQRAWTPWARRRAPSRPAKRR
jgi:acetyl-CoA acyltransferase